MAQEPLVQSAFFFASIGLLWWGATALVTSACRIARRFQISETVIGMTIVAIGTSAPEMFVTLVAAFGDKPDISIGNVVGSNIFNLGIILGLCAGIWCVPTTRLQTFRDLPALIGATLALLIFAWDLRLGATEGAIMASALLLFVIYLIGRRDEEWTQAGDVPEGELSWFDGPLLGLGLGAIVGGAGTLVWSATQLAALVGMSEWVIGVTIVAAGTSVPELATVLVAGRRGKLGLAAGSLIGSDLFNVLGVLGLAAAIHPLDLHTSARVGLVMMAATLLVLLAMMRSEWRLSRVEGGVLIALALARWGYDFWPS